MNGLPRFGRCYGCRRIVRAYVRLRLLEGPDAGRDVPLCRKCYERDVQDRPR